MASFYCALSFLLYSTVACEHLFHVPGMSDDVLIQLKHRKSSAMQAVTSECCTSCGGQPFCSPQSGNCYDSKTKDYYATCAAEPVNGDCCSKCGGAQPFCSPESGSCYASKSKDYYQGCTTTTTTSPPAPPSGSIRVMSYNLMGWNSFNVAKWRGTNVMRKIQTYGPSVVGHQEVETGGGHGSDVVSKQIESGTGLSGGAGGGQYFDNSVVEPSETGHYKLHGGYWMSMTKYKIKASGQAFLFFNTHWAHGHGTSQAETIAREVKKERERFGNLPTVLVGDTNQFCNGFDSSAWQYLLGQKGSSPITFVDAIPNDQGKSFTDWRNPNCRVDIIFLSKGDWSVQQSSIDRVGMGENGEASDHAALMAEITPLAEPVNGDCCSQCGGAQPFCSPQSGSCYASKSKDYYQDCSPTPI